jgi:hypothetical protein
MSKVKSARIVLSTILAMQKNKFIELNDNGKIKDIILDYVDVEDDSIQEQLMIIQQKQFDLAMQRG